ncbi:hypothetical protein ACGFNU_01010 [Spirillospora sp. NPDC048911]
MFPQPKKYPQVIAAVVCAVFVFKNPEQAANAVNQAIDALARFVGALG